MTECVKNGVSVKSHREWRKLAKKTRRKKIRQKLAEARNKQEEQKMRSPTYLTELAKKKLLEEYELEAEERRRQEDHAKWLKAEEEAQRLWREQLRLKMLAKEERLKEQQRIRAEWEAEQARTQKEREEQERLKKEEEEQRIRTMQRIDDFIENGGEVPSELNVVRESNPGKESCSFFTKVGACRFGNQCSRNHKHPGISKVLLLPNFYSHFTLDQNRLNEYDTDIGLEYEDTDRYTHFKEFYNDIVPEFKNYGTVRMVKVCCNTELHLRGNVYVEYRTQREALIAYRKFQGRWYGGKQLNVEFVTINDWGNAVCGDYARSRCPKGKGCNFLHVFKNPRNEYPVEWFKTKPHESPRQSSRRDWRWSESPERTRESRSERKRKDRSRSDCRGSEDRDRKRRRSKERRC